VLISAPSIYPTLDSTRAAVARVGHTDIWIY
jgi:hypothetical protein